MENILEIKNNEISLFKNKSYIKMLCASIISRIGDSIDMIAYGWMVYQLTGSELLLGTIFMVNGIPGIIFSPFTGVLVDYFSKKTLIVIGDISRGVLVSITAILYFYNIIEVWHLFVLTILMSTFETFVSPAKTSVFSLILNEEQYLKGSSVSQSADSLSQIIGTGIAGVLIGFLGIAGAILIDGISFLLSSIIILTMKITDIKSSVKLDKNNYFFSLKQGFKYVYTKKIILITIILIAAINFYLTPISALMPAYVEKVLLSDAIGLSILGVSLSLGTVLGGLVISMFDKIMKKSIMIVLGSASMGVFYSMISLPGLRFNFKYITPLYFSAFAFFFIGISTIFITAPLRTYLLKNTPKEMMGRVFGLLSMVSLCAMPIGCGISGALASIIPISILYLSMGILMIITSFLPILNKEFRSE